MRDFGSGPAMYLPSPRIAPLAVRVPPAAPINAEQVKWASNLRGDSPPGAYTLGRGSRISVWNLALLDSC